MQDKRPELLPTQKKELLKRPKTIRMNWEDRTCHNKWLYAIYRGLRMFHVTMWFYTLPFIFLVGMYFIPIYRDAKEYIDDRPLE